MYYNETDTVAVTVLAIYLVVLGLCLLGWIISFIFRGIGMYKMGKLREKRIHGLHLYRLRERIFMEN